MQANKKGAETFYKENRKSGIESVSGFGSFIRNARETMMFLEKIIRKYEIRSITDIPCGDWNWMQHIALSNIDYIGYDIIEELIVINNLKFSKPNINFEVLDILSAIPRKSDLLICRDLLFHLSLEQQAAAIENIRASGSTYLMTTTFPWIEKNKELTKEELAVQWGWRMINVEKPPFNCGDPIDRALENGNCHNREQRLYKL